MNKILLVQKIGDEVCEHCSSASDCGEEPKECFRIINAVAMLDKYLSDQADKPLEV